jgi:hypothetical protein
MSLFPATSFLVDFSMFTLYGHLILFLSSQVVMANSERENDHVELLLRGNP